MKKNLTLQFRILDKTHFNTVIFNLLNYLNKGFDHEKNYAICTSSRSTRGK